MSNIHSRLRTAVGLSVLLLLASCSSSSKILEDSGHLSRSFKQTYQQEFEGDFLIAFPEGYAGTADKWPLLLFLHGAGERGADLEQVKLHGPPKLVEEGRPFPFVVVSPQVAEGSWWDSNYLSALLDHVLQTYRIDEKRIYLTGLSMGGYGTWDLATREPHRFAAIAPICGGGKRWLGCQLKDTPVWAFHGSQDGVVPLVASREMVEAINACGGHAKLTIYPDAGHDAWSRTYADPAFYEWLLQHALP